VFSFTPRSLYPQERVPATHWIGGWVGSRAGLDAVLKRKISLLLPGLEPPTIQPVAQRYTTELSRLLLKLDSVEYSKLLYEVYMK
jgi:hypothetical protein